MATVYSLVCWGGRTGKTVTLTIASPCVVTSTNHGLRDGTGLVFSTTGALPTGITAGTTYYAKSTAANTFNLYDTAANAIAGGTTGRINTSGTQSGTHTAKSRMMLDYFDQYPGRWGDADAERCYDGLASWQSARVSLANLLISESCEIGHAFDEYPSGRPEINLSAYETIIAPEVDGVKTSAWHGGVVGQGYRFFSEPELNDWGLLFSGFYTYVSGISVVLSGNNCLGLAITATLSVFRDIITYGTQGSGQFGMAVNGVACDVENCLIAGVTGGCGLYFSDYTGLACTVSNCIIAKCEGYGVYARNDRINHSVLNTISIGNNQNWSSQPSGLTVASNNFGISEDSPWNVGTDTAIKTLTTDNTTFADYVNNDFRPASASSPQVDTALTLPRGRAKDISGAERPNYNNGGAEAWDGGCYEFDHGYGEHPATATISLTNVISGSRVLITRDDTSAVLYNDVPGTALDFETGYIGDFTVIIRKASASPYYREFTAGGTTVADQISVIKVMQQLDE